MKRLRSRSERRLKIADAFARRESQHRRLLRGVPRCGTTKQSSWIAARAQPRRPRRASHTRDDKANAPLPASDSACTAQLGVYLFLVPARVLVLFAHPALQKSRINARLAAAIRGLPGITFRDLYEEYPTFQIDVAAEQAQLIAHDIIVLQYPFFWYSCPALLKEWLDLVLEYGFAYGPAGNKLHGKSLLSAITTGGPESAYAHSGRNHYTLQELLAPFEQTARLCGMHWLPPFAVHGVGHVTDATIFDRDAADYARVLTALRDNKISAESSRSLARLNADLTALGV